MKKKILGLALVAISFVAFNSMAKNVSENTAEKQENVKGKKTDRQSPRPEVNLFEGINLSDAQRAKLQELDSRQKASRERQAQIRKDNKRQMDSTRMADRRASKKAYLDDVKSIIGPENYVTFLENMYINGGAGGHRHGDKAAFGKNKPGKRQADRKGPSEKRGDKGRNS